MSSVITFILGIMQYNSNFTLSYARISTNQEGGYNEEQMLAADVNHDGMINAVDASNILAYYAYASTTKEDICQFLNL